MFLHKNSTIYYTYKSAASISNPAPKTSEKKSYIEL